MTALDPEAIVWNLPPEARQGLPLLVLLHGRRSDERDLATLIPALPSGFAIASLRAPLSEPPGYSWFDTDDSAPSGDPDPDRADFAADEVLRWVRGIGWLPPLVGTLGFSQGGILALHLMRRDPHRFGFAVCLAGTLVRGEHHGDEVLHARRPSVFWGRGLDDPLFSHELIRRTEQWLPKHTTLTSAAYPGLGHAVSPEQLRDVADFLLGRLDAAGHGRMTADR